MKGTVKWFDRTKGYGFIIGEDGTEYFVHHTGIAPGTFIRENDEVSFDPSENERGPQAANVKREESGSKDKEENSENETEDNSNVDQEETNDTEQVEDQPNQEE